MSRAGGLLLAAALLAAGEPAADGWWPPFVPRQPPPPATPTPKGEVLALGVPELAGISGLRADWDRPIAVAIGGAMRSVDKGGNGGGAVADWSGSAPGAPVVDAVHRSLLARFPAAAEALAAAMAKGKAVARLELVLTYAGTELFPIGYLDPAGLSFLGRTWVDTPPRWHVVAWPLRVPWSADARRGPTWNAAAAGTAFWGRFGASDPQRDHHPVPLGPAEVSQQQPEGRIDLTALLTDPAFGETPAVRLRRFADQGVLLRKLEVHDQRFWVGGYEWATAIGPRGILLKDLRLEAVLKPGQPARQALPPPARPQAGGAPTAVLPSGEALRGLLRRHAFRQPAWMDEGQWRRVQELAAFDQHADFPADEAGYLAWIDDLLGRAPRRWAGFDAPEVNEIVRRYSDAMPEAVRDHLRLYWWAWLLPDREPASFAHAITGVAAGQDYVRRTGDWRGNVSVYRSYCRSQGTMNFNHWATIGTLCGAWLLDAPRLYADGRNGLETYCLRMWSWADGTSQESIDHYYYAISLATQKALADFAPGHAERMLGRSALGKSVAELASLYHPDLRRFTSPSGRTGLSYVCIQQDGLQHILHTIDPRGALTDAGARTVEDGVPVIGHDYAPGLVANQTLARPWAPAWYGALVAERSLPDQVTAAYTKWGQHRARPLWKRSWFARGWGMASTDLPENETVPFLLHWSRGPVPAGSYRDLGTLLGRYGVDRTELLDTLYHGTPTSGGNGIVSNQGGQLQCFQHRARLFVCASPSPGLKPPGAQRPLPAKPTSLQLTFGLLAFAGVPQVMIDGKPAALPARAKLGQRIVLRDGDARVALFPLLASDLGRDAEVEIAASGRSTEMQGGGRLAEALRLDVYNLRGRAPPTLDAPELDQAHVVCALTATTAAETPDLAAWEAGLAKRLPQAAWDGARKLVRLQWKGEDGTMQAAWSPTAPGDAPDQVFPERTVDGRWPYLPDGLLRTGNHLVQGTGELALANARLDLDAGRIGMLLANRTGTCAEGWNALPEASAFRLSLPGGVTVATDGKVSTCRVMIDVPHGRIEVEAAPLAGGARSMRVSGMKVASLAVNGRAVDKPGPQIDLATPAVEPGEEITDAPPAAGAERPRTARPAPAPRPAAPAVPPPTLADQAALPVWDARLRAAVTQALAAGKRPAFRSAALRAEVVVEELGADGLALRAGDSVVRQPWVKLAPAERAALAADLARDGRTETQALAAFWLLLAGERAEAERRLAQAGDEATAVRAAFTTPTPSP